MILLLLLVPLLVGGGFFLIWRSTITIKEFLLMEALAVGLTIGGYFVAKYQSLSDEEHWNGRIVAKTKETQHCCHCIPICHSCGKNCTTCTCHYLHAFDWTWGVDVSTGDHVTIDSCDGVGVAPRAWTRAKIGEPASVAHNYENYLKADPESLLRHRMNKNVRRLMKAVPAFPVVHDYYRLQRVVTIGSVRVPPRWNALLDELNADVGRRKQVDVTVVFHRYAELEFADAVEAAWVYGPKNAVIVVAAVPDGKTITYAQVVTISHVEMLKVAIRDGLAGASLSDPDRAVGVIRDQVERNFVRTPFTEFAYLAENASPSGGWMIALFVVSALATICLGLWMREVDVFGDEGGFARYTRTAFPSVSTRRRM